MLFGRQCPLLYSITPPKKNSDRSVLSSIAAKQAARLKDLDIDALIIYDIQDEVSRTSEKRPFPFLPTIDPLEYGNDFLSDVMTRKIIYSCVGKHSPSDFADRLKKLDESKSCTVFVGPASRSEISSLSLSDAYALRREAAPGLVLGGIAIPERHEKNNTEHLRMFEKQKQGCSFFVTQAVYDADFAKNLLSDYYYHAELNGLKTAPVIFTFSLCGSLKTLEFMKWLGVKFPRWLENDLKHARSILDLSFTLCVTHIRELIDFCGDKKIPIGFNIESVSIRKEEIDASIGLVQKAREIIRSLT